MYCYISNRSGKTTICQMFAEIYGNKLHSVNCHMHSESADFLGGLRPVRDPDQRVRFKFISFLYTPFLKPAKDKFLHKRKIK